MARANLGQLGNPQKVRIKKIPEIKATIFKLQGLGFDYVKFMFSKKAKKKLRNLHRRFDVK